MERFRRGSRYVIECCPELRSDSDFNHGNEGHTVVGRLGCHRELVLIMTGPPAALSFSTRRLLVALVALLAAVYVADLSWYECRVHMPNLGAATGSVHRIRLLAIPAKGNKIEYEIDSVQPEEDVPCAHALFPRGGNGPCWYVAKHASDPIPM
jgi:hypothetical protein